MFAVRQVCEKYPANEKNIVFWAFMDLEKAYDTIGFRSYPMIRSDGFPVNVRLRQGCVISPWLFNVSIDGVVQEVNARMLWKWRERMSVNGDRF